MKKFHYLFLALALSLFAVSCSDDDNENNPNNTNTDVLTPLESPYLICAGRNPGGVGFDFEYNNQKGGAYMVDTVDLKGINADIRIRTIKAEKPDGSLAGMPFIKLNDAVAVNYTALNPEEKGLEKFNALAKVDEASLNFKTDDATFSLDSLPKGTNGFPQLGAVQEQYKKLVIGMKWKATARSEEEGDEIIWIIRTNEGRLVKMIIPKFPAKPAPTPTGYVNIQWDFVN